MKIHAIQTGTVQVKKNQVVGKGSGIGRLLNMVFGREWVTPVIRSKICSLKLQMVSALTRIRRSVPCKTY